MEAGTEPLTIEITSDYYGKFRWQYLGTIDIRKLENPDDPWWNKWHPARFFTAYWGVTSEKIKSADGAPITVAWAVWVPTKAANKGWKPIPGTKYAGHDPTYRGLPIAYSDAKITKWINASKHLMVDNPRALEQAAERAANNV